MAVSVINRNVTMAMSVALVVSGCASSADNIQGSYISPIAYQSYTCRQLSEEAQRISSRVASVTGVQNSKAASDAVATGVALVVFWPAAFFVRGDGTTAAEVARLKGEMEAVEQASIKKNCNIQFNRSEKAT